MIDFRNNNTALSFRWGWENRGWRRLRMLKNLVIGNQQTSYKVVASIYSNMWMLLINMEICSKRNSLEV